MNEEKIKINQIDTKSNMSDIKTLAAKYYQAMERGGISVPESKDTKPVSPPDDNNAMAWFRHACDLSDDNHCTEAEAAIDKAIAIYPDYVDAWNLRGYMLSEFDRHVEAVASYDKAISISGKQCAIAWSYRGMTLFELGQFAEAVASFDKADSIDKDSNRGFQNYRGRALSELSRYSEAVASYDKAIADSHNGADVWYYRGVALGELGRYAEAVASYDKAIAIKPDCFKAKQNREIALKKMT